MFAIINMPSLITFLLITLFAALIIAQVNLFLAALVSSCVYLYNYAATEASKKRAFKNINKYDDICEEYVFTFVCT